MPSSDDWIFVCRKEHVDDYRVDQILRKEVSKCKIIIVDKTTEGQASTCLLAKNFIDLEKPLFIGSCDNAMIWNKKKYLNLMDKYDVLVWTFTKQNELLIKPEKWGWIKSKDGESVDKVSIKKTVSRTPYNDYALTGAFSFRNGKIFLDVADKVIKDNIRINNEFYVYEAISVVSYTPLYKWIKRGKKSHYVIKRLKNADKYLTADNINKLKKAGKVYKARKYDLYFEWSDDKIYCSELVWKIYKRALNIEIGTPEKLKDFDLNHPTVKSLLDKRYRGNPPLEETVISPESMYKSKNLITVISR